MADNQNPVEEVADAVTGPVQKPTPPREVVQRVARTLLQLVAGGGLTLLTDQIASDLPASYLPYFTIFYTFLVSFAQNMLESEYPQLTILKK